MAYLSHLTPNEGKDLIHLIENKKRTFLDDDKQRTWDLLD